MEKEGAGVEVGRASKYIYSDTELDRAEGEEIETLKAHSQQPIPDPDRWLDEELRRNILLTTLDAVLNWARRSSLWPVTFAPACCAFETASCTALSRLPVFVSRYLGIFILLC